VKPLGAADEREFFDRHGCLPTLWEAFETPENRTVFLATLAYMPEDVDVVVGEFIKFVYSDEGAAIVKQLRMFPALDKSRNRGLVRFNPRPKVVLPPPESNANTAPANPRERPWIKLIFADGGKLIVRVSSTGTDVVDHSGQVIHKLG
jgi:hypothetical protein